MFGLESSDYHAQVAALRPGAAPNGLESLLRTALQKVPEFRIYKWKDFRLELAPDGRILECTFQSDFPVDIEIEGLHMRMPMAEARQAQPSLRYLGPQSFGEGYDVVPADTTWDLLVDEVSDKVQRLTFVLKGDADERLARGQQVLASAARSWQQVAERDLWMTLDDPDALLGAWLEGEHARAPWSDHPKDINAVYAAWLRQASADELHMAALGHNWSYSLAPLFYISRRPDCDLATALHIFYAGSAYEHARVNFDPARISSTGHATLRLTIGIRDRVLSGFYRRTELALDFGPYWTPPQVGPEFPVKLAGRTPEPVAIDDGYPVAVWESLGTKSPAPNL